MDPNTDDTKYVLYSEAATRQLSLLNSTVLKFLNLLNFFF
jgi:hypothetical protein